MSTAHFITIKMNNNWSRIIAKRNRDQIIELSVWKISLLSIPSNWWTGFSSWEDFFGLMCTGTKLPIHSVVLKVNRSLERVECGICTIDHVSENGDISIDLHEDFPTLMKGYQINANRKQLRTLKQIAAYNVAKCISNNSDVQSLYIPMSLYKIDSIFLDENFYFLPL